MRSLAVLALAGSTLPACQSSTADPTPAALLGEWRLAASGGATTGKIDSVPASSDTRLVFENSHVMATYRNGQLLEKTSYQLRSEPNSSGSPDYQYLLVKRRHSPNGQAYDSREDISLLTGSELHLSIGDGCALVSQYGRVNPLWPR